MLAANQPKPPNQPKPAKARQTLAAAASTTASSLSNAAVPGRLLKKATAQSCAEVGEHNAAQSSALATSTTGLALA